VNSKRVGRPLRFGRALDFGCGPGRVTRALAAWFDESVGVDVSPVMIAEALKGALKDVKGVRLRVMHRDS